MERGCAAREGRRQRTTTRAGVTAVRKAGRAQGWQKIKGSFMSKQQKEEKARDETGRKKAERGESRSARAGQPAQRQGAKAADATKDSGQDTAALLPSSSRGRGGEKEGQGEKGTLAAAYICGPSRTCCTMLTTSTASFPLCPLRTSRSPTPSAHLAARGRTLRTRNAPLLAATLRPRGMMTGTLLPPPPPLPRCCCRSAPPCRCRPRLGRFPRACPAPLPFSTAAAAALGTSSCPPSQPAWPFYRAAAVGRFRRGLRRTWVHFWRWRQTPFLAQLSQGSWRGERAAGAAGRGGNSGEKGRDDNDSQHGGPSRSAPFSLLLSNR